MAKGIGHEFHRVLHRLVEPNESKGVYVRDLRLLAEYHVQVNQLDIRFASSMFTPLTEMFLVSTNIHHQINKNKDGVYVSGIGFVKYETRELIEALTLGIASSTKVAEDAKRLYSIIFN